jgi:hypothetical protein
MTQGVNCGAIAIKTVRESPLSLREEADWGLGFLVLFCQEKRTNSPLFAIFNLAKY